MEILVIVVAIVVMGELYYWFKRLSDRNSAEESEAASMLKDFPAAQVVPARTEKNLARGRETDSGLRRRSGDSRH